MEMSSSSYGEVRQEVCKDWLINIEEDLEPGTECCIYRVPTRIRKVNEEAYTPQVVSIGPFHHGKKELEVMEKQKGIYVREFCKRTTREKREEILAFIKDHEQQIRNCYSETCKLESGEYVKMILRDAIFIIELFLRDYDDDTTDFLLSIPAERMHLELDLQLLENQLPYFLLKGLYKFVGCSTPPFTKLCCDFFDVGSVPCQTEMKHFTDLQRAALVESYPQLKFDHVYSDVDLPCAVKLRESGVKFKRAIENKCLLDIRFDVPELKIPQLKVFDGTETTLRNIMALEQCHYPYDTPVCDYVELLDSLIDTKGDVDLLIKEEIISNCMGDSTAIVSLFNRLCSQIILNRVYYNNISLQLKEHYDDTWNHTSATFRSVYFSDLWKGTATVAAAVLLILTLVQTVSSVIQVIKM